MDVGKTDSRTRPELFLWPWAATTYSSMTGISPSQFTNLNNQMNAAGQCFNNTVSTPTDPALRMNIPTTAASLNTILRDSNSMVVGRDHQTSRSAVTSMAMALASVTAGANHSTHPIITGRNNSLHNDPVRRNSHKNDITAAAVALAALSDQQNFPLDSETKGRLDYLKQPVVNNNSSEGTNSQNTTGSDPHNTRRTSPGASTTAYLRSSGMLNGNNDENSSTSPGHHTGDGHVLNGLNGKPDESGTMLTTTNGSSNSSALTPNSNYTQTTKAYKCKLCHTVCYSKSDLATHNAVNHNQDPRPHRCEQCGRQFSTCAYLSQHRRIHTGNKPYNCRFCERRFTQLSHQQQHERIHTGEKPYKCAHCSKAFTQMSNLQSHQRQHMKGKPHRCEHCFLSFDARNELEEHLQSKHAGNRYAKILVCPYCSKSYNSETYLSKHVERHKEANLNEPGFQFPGRNNTKNVTAHQVSGVPSQQQQQSTDVSSSVYLSMNGSSNETFDQYASNGTRANLDLSNQIQKSIIQNNNSVNHLNQISTHSTDVQQLIANQTMLLKLEQQQQQLQRQQSLHLANRSTPNASNNSPVNGIASPLQSTTNNLMANYVSNSNGEIDISTSSGSHHLGNESLMTSLYGSSSNSTSNINRNNTNTGVNVNYPQTQMDLITFNNTTNNAMTNQLQTNVSPESIAAMARAFSFNSKINRTTTNPSSDINSHPSANNNNTLACLDSGNGVTSQKDSVQNFSRSLDMFLQATNTSSDNKTNFQQPTFTPSNTGNNNNGIHQDLNTSTASSSVGRSVSNNPSGRSRKRSADADANNNKTLVAGKSR